MVNRRGHMPSACELERRWSQQTPANLRRLHLTGIAFIGGALWVIWELLENPSLSQVQLTLPQSGFGKGLPTICPVMWGRIGRFYTTFSLTGPECRLSFINRLGYSDARTRADSPRHSRFAHSESRLSGPALRLRHSAAHRTDFPRSPADRTGRALPRAVSTCAAGIVEGSLGHVGEQSTDQVLRADNRRAETFAPAGGRLEPPGRRNWLSA